jgi:4-hydroxyproline epimerase
MFEPRGHDVMSGSVLYPPTRPDCDVAILFIEVSGCLPMCGHGTIGTVTVAIEHGLVTPKTPGLLRLDTPAGVIEAQYKMDGEFVSSVRIRNIASYLHAVDLEINVPGLGLLRADVAYGGNFYAIIEPQKNFTDLADLGPSEIQRLSPIVRDLMNDARVELEPLPAWPNGQHVVNWKKAMCLCMKALLVVCSKDGSKDGPMLGITMQSFHQLKDGPVFTG